MWRYPLLSWGLKLSNPKPACKVATLHFFQKGIQLWIPKIEFSLRSILCFPKMWLTPLHCWKVKWGLNVSFNLQTPLKRLFSQSHSKPHPHCLYVSVHVEQYCVMSTACREKC
jgi:hypothetical protein